MGQSAGWPPDPRPTRPSMLDGRHVGNAALGFALIAIGGLLLFQRLTGFDVWHYLWPFFVIIPGLVFLVAAFLSGRSASGLAIPGTIITTTGLLLLVQNTFQIWQTWAYAWALVAPTSVGLGIWLAGLLSGQVGQQRAGRRVAEIGLALFVAFTAFFEILLRLSGPFAGNRGGLIVGVGFILVGAYLLVRRNEGTPWY
jgi:hypothetical protein